MALKFLHAADIHLGRPFSGLTRSSPILGKLFREAGYEAWNRIVQAAVDRRVDFVTLAGDTFDSGNPTVRARVVFRDGLARLHEGGIRVYMVLGNHDPLVSFPESLKTLPGLHVFATEPEALCADSAENMPGVVICGASFEKAAVTENLVRKFRRDPGIDLAVGVLHANVAGEWGHKNYAPCTGEDLKIAGMDVWCLGHVHAPVMLAEDPLIFYPGTAQGAHINETGPRGCCIITVDSNGSQLERLNLAPVRWERMDLEIADITDADQVLHLCEEACSKFVVEQETLKAAVVRISLIGTQSDDGIRAAVDPVDFFDVLSERLSSLPVPVFPESVRYARHASIDLESLMKEEGFLAEYLRMCRKSARDAKLRHEILDELHGKLASNVGHRFLDADLDGRYIRDHPEAADRLLNRCAELVAHMFVQHSEGAD